MTGAARPHPGDGAHTILHASAVALDAGRGLLILGASGSGKSALALMLMAMGARLVADDRVCLAAAAGTLTAWAPDTLAGVIEARGMGLLGAPPLPLATLCLAVDLDIEETERLPPRRTWSHMKCDLPLFRRVAAPHFAAGLMQALRTGRTA